MKVAVVGAGIIGVTTAYELGADGHEVTVFERLGHVAAEGSFANAGIVTPGWIAAVAAPGVAGLIGRWRGHGVPAAPIRRANRARLLRLAVFSRERLHRVTRELKLDYERSDGVLVLLRTPKDTASAQAGLAWLKESKTRFDLLDAKQCCAVETNLNPDISLHAGIYMPDAEVGNCRQFAHLLRVEAQRLGVRFRFHTQVQALVAGPMPALVHMYAPPEDATPSSLIAESGPSDAHDTQPLAPHPVTEGFDAIVVCAALATHRLLRPHGLKLALRAVHGYSITAPLRRHDGYFDRGPRSALLDPHHAVSIARLGSRVRVAGGAQIGDSLQQRHHAGTLDVLYKVLNDWFPGAARASEAQTWKGARPTLPDGPPLLGRSGLDGVWLNLGHGDVGWMLACGSARVLADAIAGRPAIIDTEGLGVERLKKGAR